MARDHTLFQHTGVQVRRSLEGMAMVLGAAILWGTTGTAQALLPAGLPAHWVGALRLLVAGVFFWAFVLVVPRATPLRTQLGSIHWRWVSAAGFSMAAYNLTFFAGVKASSVSVGTAIALGSGPLWAGLIQIAVTGRAPGRPWWIGTMLAVAGGGWMVLASVQGLQMSVLGVGLCLLSGLSYAVYTLISKRQLGRTPASMLAACIFSVAAAVAAPAAWSVSGLPMAAPRVWWIVLYLGVAATGIAYLLFTHALARISSGSAVAICLAEPLTAFCLAILVIGEQPPAAGFAGLGLVMLGLALVVRAELRTTEG